MPAATRAVVLLRGVNVGRAKRIAMSEFASVLGDLGATEVRTLLNSGNAVCTTTVAPERLGATVAEAIRERLGFGCDVVVRTQRQVAAVVALDPLAAVATDPSRYLVVFLGSTPHPASVARLRAIDVAPEEWVLDGDELYLWMPAGVAASVVSQHLARGVLGVTWTGRNVATVRKILDAM